jgi:predicted nucleotide-binding protein (sugar kinase/HSP70/actin superfamily)
MGNMYICIRAVLEKLGVNVVVPPPSSKQTLTLGSQHSPEFACLPLKLNLGNFIEARKLGANTIVMAGGVGPCRFGYYAQIQREILKDMGHDYRMIVLEPPDKHISQLLVELKQLAGGNNWWKIIKALQFAWQKVAAVDRLEKSVQKLRPRELKSGVVDRVYDVGLAKIDAAQDLVSIRAVEAETMEQLNAIPVDWSRPCLKIGLVGEIYLLLEPFANFHIERRLGQLGIEVERSIYLSEWVNENLFLGLVRGVKDSEQAKAKARPYLNHFIGGHGQESIGHAIHFQDQGFAGVIQLAPFTCMPEIVAQSIFAKVRVERDLPTLSLIIDEHAGEAGLVTRLEAFVDLLRRQQQLKEAVTYEPIFGH